MNHSSDEENFEILNMNPFSAKDLPEKGIDLDSNLFNYTKFQQ